MIRLIAAAGFIVAVATSAQAITPAPLPQPDGMITQVRFGCGPGRTRVAGVCHQDHHGLAVLALLGPGDELVAPAHDLADVRKAEELELADDLLDRHLGALSPGAHDLRDAGLNPNIS